jgi:hypothetical protein
LKSCASLLLRIVSQYSGSVFPEVGGVDVCGVFDLAGVERVGFLAGGFFVVFVVAVFFGGGIAGLLSAPTCEKTTVDSKPIRIKHSANPRVLFIS